jgi:predicted GNAT superfamily acetyltransferase
MWCSPCASAADEAQSVQDAYADKGLVYITVLVENTKREEPTVSDLQAWAETFGNVTTPVVAGARSMLESSGDGTWTVEGWPTFYYIDRKMVTRDIDRGFSSEEVALSIEWLLSLDKPEE